MNNARECAMRIIYNIEYNGAFSNLAVKQGMTGGFSPRDKALITNLVYGVIGRKLTLDYMISKHSMLRIKKISKYILTILRMGIYQLKFMDKIPESAAVNESVKLAKRYGHGASAGFVNGVLRQAAKCNVEYPDDKTEYLSVRYSYPIPLCEKWIEEFGYDFTKELMEGFGETPRLCLRHNALKTTNDELLKLFTDNNVNARAEKDYIIAEGLDVASDELYKKGFYTVQDPSAMEAAKTLAPKAYETVIDMCAAPGGKTTHIAELMNNKGKIYAFDVREHKIELIRKNASRIGADIIEPLIGDGRIYNEMYKEKADKILCDVPCSGYGIIRRKPEIKYNDRANERQLSEIQSAILNNAALYLKKNGEIVYSTCTIEKDENEMVTGEFLKKHKNFTKLSERTFYPHKEGCDGFYICSMKRIS